MLHKARVFVEETRTPKPVREGWIPEQLRTSKELGFRERSGFGIVIASGDWFEIDTMIRLNKGKLLVDDSPLILRERMQMVSLSPKAARAVGLSQQMPKMDWNLKGLRGYREVEPNIYMVRHLGHLHRVEFYA